MRILIIFGLIITYFFTVPGASGVLASEQAKPLARVYATYIYEKDITLPDKSTASKRKQLTKDKYKKWYADYQQKIFAAIFMRRLQDAFLKQKNNEPTEAEIQSHITFMAKAKKGQLARYLKQREGVVKDLQAPDLNEKKKASLIKYRDTLDSLIKSEKQQRERSKKNPNYEQMQKKASRRVAEVMVRQFKYNQALYQTYGGRVIFQQAGIEPIDAYARVLDDWRKQKAYEILDERFKDVFSSYEAYLKMGHNFLPMDENKKYFDKPFWEKALPEDYR